MVEVDLTTTQGGISAEYVGGRLDGYNYNDVLSGDENRNLIAGVGGDDTIFEAWVVMTCWAAVTEVIQFMGVLGMIS